MDKNYNFQEAEEKWYSFWQDKQLFEANPNSLKPHYSLLMPPPNLTGSLHLGHAMQHSILDAIARFKRMQGFDVLLLPGVDHAGIQFEGTLNKVLAKEGLSKEGLGKAEWLKRAWQFKKEVYQSFKSTWSVFGISADFSREVFSLEEKVQKGVFEEFKRFWEQDLLYKGAYIVQWCPKCGSAIEDLEMEYEEKKENLYFVRYFIEDAPEYITVATARPETIFADTGIAVYPDHPEFKKFIGKNALNPLTDKKIPIFENERVNKGFGTGALKITPGHDPLDFQIGQEHNLEILHAIDKTGHMSEITQELAGIPVLQAREEAVKKLQNLNSLEKTEEYTHSVPICERCKTTIEPLVSDEWFVKMTPLTEKALGHIKKINFFPTNYKDLITEWLENIHDWSISRSLWWGHQIPVWYCQNCNPHHLVSKDKELTISLNKPDFPCQRCHQGNWAQDEQVLDTWFSSGMWPLVTLGWPNQTEELSRYYPWNFEISAHEIKFLWIARMIILGCWFTEKIPFENMFFHGMIRDLQGRKFSKSLGNGIDPNELRNRWGTDSLRMALYAYSAPGRDGKASFQTMDEKARSYRNFTTKLWNITRFILIPPASGETNIETLSNENNPDKNQNLILNNNSTKSKKIKFSNKDDRWIIKELNETIEGVTRNIDKFQLHLATEQLYHFIWHKFADIYIEKSKQRRQESQACLEYVLKTSLKLLHPFMPFITEELWQKLPEEKEQSILLSSWPEVLD